MLYLLHASLCVQLAIINIICILWNPTLHFTDGFPGFNHFSGLDCLALLCWCIGQLGIWALD